jgi:hypothetical protein
MKSGSDEKVKAGEEALCGQRQACTHSDGLVIYERIHVASRHFVLCQCTSLVRADDGSAPECLDGYRRWMKKEAGKFARVRSVIGVEREPWALGQKPARLTWQLLHNGMALGHTHDTQGQRDGDDDGKAFRDGGHGPVGGKGGTSMTRAVV